MDNESQQDMDHFSTGTRSLPRSYRSAFGSPLSKSSPVSSSCMEHVSQSDSDSSPTLDGYKASPWNAYITFDDLITEYDCVLLCTTDHYFVVQNTNVYYCVLQFTTS